jgi:uncharacterized protein YutE (UPF0331/DUF86 family)
MTPGPINRIVVADKMALVGRMLDGIRTLPLETIGAFTADPRMVAAGDSYLRRGLEALLDLARHVLAKGFSRAPAEYAEVARQLGEVGVVRPEQARLLELMARYRNRMVHAYDDISDDELYGILTRHLPEIETIAQAIVRWVADRPGPTGDPA